MTVILFVLGAVVAFLVNLMSWKDGYKAGLKNKTELQKQINELMESSKVLREASETMRLEFAKSRAENSELHKKLENLKAINSAQTKSLEDSAKLSESEVTYYIDLLNKKEVDFNLLREELEIAFGKLSQESQKYSDAITEIADLQDAIQEVTNVNTELDEENKELQRKNEDLNKVIEEQKVGFLREVQGSIDREEKARKMVVERVLESLVNITSKNTLEDMLEEITQF